MFSSIEIFDNFRVLFLQKILIFFLQRIELTTGKVLIDTI